MKCLFRKSCKRALSFVPKIFFTDSGQLRIDTKWRVISVDDLNFRRLAKNLYFKFPVNKLVIIEKNLASMVDLWCSILLELPRMEILKGLANL